MDYGIFELKVNSEITLKLIKYFVSRFNSLIKTDSNILKFLKISSIWKFVKIAFT